MAANETSASLIITATSTVDKSKSGTANVTVSGVPIVNGIMVDPLTANVAKGGTKKFSATVTGTGNPDETVDWEVIGKKSEGTTIDTNGMLTVASDETSTSLTVRATSTFDSDKFGTATITVITVSSVTVSPAGATLVKGGTQPFTAMVEGTGDPPQTVTWTVNSTKGTTISTAGVLTVAFGETATTLIVTATSTKDTNKSGTATVTLPGYTDIVPVTTTTVPITGDSAYYYDSSVNNRKGVFIEGRTVILSPFYIAQYETTYELWYTVHQWAIGNGYTFAHPGREGHDGSAGAAPTGRKYEPVTNISWRDAVVWCNAYSEMSGKDPVYRDASNAVLKDSTASVETLGLVHTTWNQ